MTLCIRLGRIRSGCSGTDKTNVLLFQMYIASVHAIVLDKESRNEDIEDRRICQDS